jgi:CysZ protein
MACYNYNRQEDKCNMLNSIIKTLNQISTAPFRRVLFLSVSISLLTTLLLWAFITKIIFNTNMTSITWLEWFLDILGGGAVFILLVLLLPTLVGLIASIMLESICRSVELVYYPHLPKAQGQNLYTGVLVGLKFTGTMIVLNIIFLPLIVIPPVYIFASWVLNSYLLSREFFELVAYRRLDKVNVNRMYKKFRFTLIGYGLVIAFISIIPVINFIVPLFGTAVMLHAFQRIQNIELV